MNTPFYDRIAQLASRDTARFHMPAHKGNPAALPAFSALLRYDLTEIEGADDLSNPVGPLAQSEKNMSRAYGSGATLYSASGSTACVQAMFTLFLRPGQEVVMLRGCHASAIRALAFLNLHPRWVQPRQGRAQAADINAALQTGGAKAVFLTSPDYYGRMPDIAAIARVCHQNNALLLVDNAHGAHLRFADTDRHPLSQGADATADSAHKTLPCLTPAAMLHLRDGTLAAKAREALNLYSSTSPSYPVLLSLDLAAGMLLESPPSFSATARQLAALAAGAPHLVENTDDPLRLCLHPARGGWSAQMVYTALQNNGVVPELYDGTRIVLMASPWNAPQDFLRIRQILEQFMQNQPLYSDESLLPMPQQALSTRDAIFGEKERISTSAAAGRIMAGLHAPCPPGVPLVLPGEYISKQAAPLLSAGGILQVDVVK